MPETIWVDPNMPASQMLLHFGEMTAQEVRTARAAIRFANTKASAMLIEAERRGMVRAAEICDEVDADYFKEVGLALICADLIRQAAAELGAK